MGGWSDEDERRITAACPHAIDQGAVCYSDDAVTQLQDWAAQNTCGGCDVGCGLAGADNRRIEDTQTIFFGCIDFYSARCTFDATGGRGSYTRALNEFVACAEVGGHVAGYCHGSLKSAAMLRNQDVCVDGSAENIAFHIRIPFVAEAEQTIHFRYHADFGQGSFIGVDGAQHTVSAATVGLLTVSQTLTVDRCEQPGDLWGKLPRYCWHLGCILPRVPAISLRTGHVQVSDVSVGVGDHEFEALGFEGCCDGHSELEVHLPCDVPSDPWRVVTAGVSICMSCGWDGTNMCECSNDGRLGPTVAATLTVDRCCEQTRHPSQSSLTTPTTHSAM